MGAASKAGDLVFKAFVGVLGVTTIYLTATFSVNVYRGLSWHKAQSGLKERTWVGNFAVAILWVRTGKIHVPMQ
ncbi:hypothetical protein H5410_033739 [Solanum commersonii]|uniref:Uncharacterized protein n=1 Tax=Solanum commersonii TaxID=4109 RepID=A0A9J5YPI1_SOLCO|nr:hypothetical protein H5410_033739 [Solanum commersonii]